MNLTRYEQETIVNYNEEEKTASIYTHNAALRRRLDELARIRPDDCKIGRTSRDGQAAEYSIPKSWIKVKPPRVASEAQKEALRKARSSLKSAAYAESAEDKSA